MESNLHMSSEAPAGNGARRWSLRMGNPGIAAAATACALAASLAGAFAAWRLADQAPSLVLFAGAAQALLLAALTWMFLRAGRRAAALAAGRMHMAASESRYRSMIHLCADWYWETDDEHRLSYIGGAFAKGMGMRPEACLGRVMWDIAGIAPANGRWDEHRDTLARGRAFRDFELTLDVGGKLRHVALSGEPMFDAKGMCCGFRGVGLDITASVGVRQELRHTNERLLRTVDALERRNREGALLGEMAEVLQVCASVNEACALLPHYLGQIFHGMAASVYLKREGENTLVPVAGSDLARDTLKPFPGEECWALRRSATHVLHHAESGLCCAHAQPTPEHGYLCVPMTAQSETTGMLHLRFPASVDEEERSLLERLAQRVTGQLALAFLNLRLRESLAAQALRDPLTGLYNRRYMEDALAREFIASARKGTPVGLIMFDVDHFKRMNDTHGHDAGDAVLRALGQVALKHVRGSDIACRYGGEEFLLILPGATIEGAAARAKQLCAAIRELRITHYGRDLGPVTVSAGVAAAPGSALEPHRLFAAVDSALYTAKREGRDRVVVFGAPAAARPRRTAPIAVAAA